ncbi:MAG TPA: aldo/keto reductase [Thermoanaerobaculia bacterium]|nr:aldo/keto reductase [Thermoanaerobaculia bacterium]
MIKGRSTLEGTSRFAARSPAAAAHFREAIGAKLSSIGLGTYLGDEDPATDAGYEKCVAAALERGINVFDSAINYRGQRSERAIGRALARAIDGGRVQRDEIFVSTKGGYLPHDSEDPRDPRRYILETFVESGVAPKAEIARGGHCLSPAYLEDQIERSRANLGLETIDLYYLHNVETQRGSVDAAAFRKRLAAAAKVLEAAARRGRIAAWGLATWDGLRVPPEHPEHVSIQEVVDIAKEAAGAGHHFSAVQLPFNLAMAQAVAYPSQDSGGQRLPALAAAARAGLAAFGSASLLQGRLAGDLPEEIEQTFPEASTGGQRALQFSRSAPGMTVSLVGVSTPAHAADNFALSAVPPAPPERVLGLFS